MDPLEGAEPGMSRAEHVAFSLTHRHTGQQGQGQKIQAAQLDTTAPFADGAEPIYLPVNAPTSGRQYRIQVVEVTDPDTQQISPVIQVVPV